MFRVRTMEQLASDAVAQPRLYLMLLGLFAAASVLLAAIGIYGVLAHGVSQRTREIGLRLALGAERGRVLRMVVGQALALALGGLALGLASAAGLSRLLGGLLFGVEPGDLPTYLAAAAGLALVAVVASVVPACGPRASIPSPPCAPSKRRRGWRGDIQLPHPPMTRQYCHVGSRTIAYLDSAPGARDLRAIVLLHAFPLGASMWEPQSAACPRAGG